ncbi:hypothetical protein [Lactobacillus sp. M0390]|uniref:hypothetical protein n=1 Tax=Lactobacillus sp. M0390 TaxID=2751026 RepID=UPI0018DD4238|nr:hypothetical protein [Lactobacillus sp. M0390]MBH9986597.1 hypothetical protein [Lactobacillus sp. M0390]
MAEETANWQDSNGATTQTSSATEKMYIQVYKSTDEVPCEVWFAPKNAEIRQPFTLTPPNPDFKNPKFDFINYSWFDLGTETQAQKIGAIADAVDNLKEKTKDVIQNNDALQQSLGSISKSQQSQSQQLAQMLQLIAPMVAQNAGGANNA